MKKRRSSPVLFITLLSFSLCCLSCGDDAPINENMAYVVDVQIISPDNNATLTEGEDFVVEVDYTRKDNIIHNIKVEILDASGNTVKKLVERHAHVANNFTFKSDAFSLDQTGVYTIRAATTDLHEEGEGHGEGNPHDSQENVMEHTITVQ